jgi:tetratricopeptide (TPR) repeat protein
MSKDKIQLLSPLFLKYQEDFEKNPRSRVFAPLAETYRKLGMTDKAMEILSQGIRFHPTYVMGYLGLAFCYFDIRQFNLAYSTLRPLVENSRDNIRLQKLFADVCLELGYRDEALDTYKYLLFINPRDKEAADRVSTLEKILEEQYKPVHQPIYIPESEFKSPAIASHNEQMFDIDKLENRPNASQADFDDWMALDLSREQKLTKTSDPYDSWNLKKGDGHLDLSHKEDAKEIVIEEIQAEEAPVEKMADIQREEHRWPQEETVHHDSLKIDLDLDSDETLELEQEAPKETIKETPLVTHTLVDLYIGQGHIEKALEVLGKILSLNPRDQKTIDKISEIKTMMSGAEEETIVVKEEVESKEFNIEELFNSHPKAKKPAKPKLSVVSEASEEDGRKQLMSIFDEQVKPVELKEDIKKANGAEKARAIEEKLSQFLKKIQKRALDYQARL